MTASDIYVRLRTGQIWLALISIFSGSWMSWNWFAWHYAPPLAFDTPGYPGLTLVLSVEASIAASMILDKQNRQAADQQQLLTYIAHLMETERDRTNVVVSLLRRLDATA